MFVQHTGLTVFQTCFKIQLGIFQGSFRKEEGENEYGLGAQKLISHRTHLQIEQDEL